MTTILRVTLPAGALILETARDPLDCCDYVRQKLCGDLPAKDERFEAAMKIRADAVRVQREALRVH